MKGSAAFLIGISLGVVLLDSVGLPRIIMTGPVGRPLLSQFSSYDELKTFLNESAYSGPPYYKDFSFGRTLTNTPTFTTFETGQGSGTVEYSTTNIQVEGVDEADIVKTDGEYLYLASNGQILIVRAYPAEAAKVLARIQLNGTVLGIFLNKDRLVVFASEFLYTTRGLSLIGYGWSQGSVKVYNIEDRDNPLLTRNLSVNGTYFNSRMIGDYVYVLFTTPAYLTDNEVYLPAISSGDQVEKVVASSIYYSNVSDYYYSFTTVVAVDVLNEQEPITQETFLFGSASNIYVSLNSIYVAVPKYGDAGLAETAKELTDIHRIQVENGKVVYSASGQVPGLVLNQFSMDEYNGYFRIATTSGHVSTVFGLSTSLNHVYTLNMTLGIVGRLENLAPGEKIYSARFIGERCYLVTFKKVDPLFVISLEDPANPIILGKLKIPGYSDYLHPYDENHVIGIGKWTVEAEQGDFAWYQGVKISLFDVSDLEHPIEAASYIIGDRGTDSPVLHDPKALLFDRTRKLLAIPVLVAEIDRTKYPNGVPSTAYGDYVFQGTYVFTITESSITLRGRITHLNNATDLLKSGYWFQSDYSVQRMLYIDDVLYTISAKRIKMNSLTTLAEINKIDLP